MLSIPFPSPRPSPRGEGERSTVSRAGSNGSTNPGVSNLFADGIPVPSPRGEGKGEGKRDVTNPHAQRSRTDSTRLTGVSDSSQECWHAQHPFPLTPALSPGRGGTFDRLSSWFKRLDQSRRVKFVRRRNPGSLSSGRG